ncbi:dihydrofolate reductase family protein [Nesterenkonia muleiensis]|uniref:dihydrofolate reductase family protein n=1 Tax=Nesterenkonia muleiensis TaxID=2282648 RepID=UPI000E746397|nr:dihydrofolate reductase family protein [Nesterenkonia muleiensis]
MRELVYYVAASMDGYIAAPDGRFDAFLLEGDHLSEVTTRFADALPTDAAEHLGIDQPCDRFATVLMGWHTYAHAVEAGVESPYRHLEQIVFSRRRHAVAENLRTVDTGPATLVRELKHAPGADIWLCGGGSMAGQLIAEIDRIIIKRNPLVFGSGIPLFEPTGYAPTRFELIDSKSFISGVIISEYTREGRER